MDDYKPNSHKFKNEQRVPGGERERAQKVVKGVVKTKKKSGINKLTDIFISQDITDVKSYILMDVLVPTVKKTIMGSLDMILNGKSNDYSRPSGSKVSYRKYYDDARDERRYEGLKTRNRFDYDDLIFESRGEAEVVLDQMRGSIQRYGLVTVGDMYDMADITQPFTSNNYGWTDLSSAYVERVRDGYMIRLPKALPID